LITNLLNPKVGVFYMTLLPQFIPAGAPVFLLSISMAAIHALEGMAWFVLITLLAQTFHRWVTSPVVARRLDRVSGVVFIGFGVRLAAER
jgi:threonine/homoserine/homoserine lactone efflux protein